MLRKKERGLFIQSSVLIAMIVIIIALILILVYFFYSPPQKQSGAQNGNANEPQIGNWDVYVNNNKTKIIYAQTQSDGTAKWSGVVKIVVYDQNGSTLEGVKILLQGCGILQGGVTPNNGTLIFSLRNVTLPSGVSEGSIMVQISYEKTSSPQLIQDSLTVLRKY